MVHRRHWYVCINLLVCVIGETKHTHISQFYVNLKEKTFCRSTPSPLQLAYGTRLKQPILTTTQKCVQCECWILNPSCLALYSHCAALLANAAIVTVCEKKQKGENTQKPAVSRNRNNLISEKDSNSFLWKISLEYRRIL